MILLIVIICAFLLKFFRVFFLWLISFFISINIVLILSSSFFKILILVYKKFNQIIKTKNQWMNNLINLYPAIRNISIQFKQKSKRWKYLLTFFSDLWYLGDKLIWSFLTICTLPTLLIVWLSLVMSLWLYDLLLLCLLFCHHRSPLLILTGLLCHSANLTNTSSTRWHRTTCLFHTIPRNVAWACRYIVVLTIVLLSVGLGIDAHLLAMSLIHLVGIISRYGGVLINISEIVIFKVIFIYIILKLFSLVLILALLVLLLQPRWHLRNHFTWTILLLSLAWRSLCILLLHVLLLLSLVHRIYLNF